MSDKRTRDAPTSGATSDRDPGASTRAEDRSAFGFGEPRDDESLPELVRRLAEQGSELAQQQVKLVEAEVRSSINDLKESAGAMAGAAVLGLAGVGVLLMGLAYLLDEFMQLWLATLIVAAGALAGAYAMFVAGQKKLRSSSLSVDRTRRTLERAPHAISGNPSQGSTNDR